MRIVLGAIKVVAQVSNTNKCSWIKELGLRISYNTDIYLSWLITACLIYDNLRELGQKFKYFLLADNYVYT